MFEDEESHLKKNQMDVQSGWQELASNPRFTGRRKTNKWNDRTTSFENESDKSKVVNESGVFSY